MGEPRQMMLLAVVAGHAILAAVDGDAHLGHGLPPVSRGQSASDPNRIAGRSSLLILRMILS